MKMLKSKSIVILVGVVLVLAGSLSADTMTLGIAQDNYVVGSPVDAQWQNRGWENIVSIGTHYGTAWGDCRGLVQFDTSSIPAGQVIQSATLRVYHFWDLPNAIGWNPSIGNVTSVYRSLVPWAEKMDTTTGPNKLPGPDGNPDMSNFGYREPGIPWASGEGDFGSYNGPLPDGSDFIATATDTVSVSVGSNGGVGYFGWVEFNVTADVAAFYSGTAANNGWLMKGNEDRIADGFGLRWDFYSREDTANLSLHPQLVVNYIPEPATMCLLGLGGLTLLRKKIA